MTIRTLRLASNPRILVRALGAVGLSLISLPGWPQQTAPRTTALERESSVTVQQIVARQEEHYRKIATTQGTVVWVESSGSPPRRETRYIHFARQGDNAVTLVLPEDQAGSYSGTESTLKWSRVLAANLIAGDVVQSVDRPTTGGKPSVRTVRFNPAVHDNNPLANYHLRHMGDDPLPLRELATAIPSMKTRPKVLDVMANGLNSVRIEFQNSAVPGEKLVYEIDPSRGWLTTGIGRISGGKFLSRTSIVIGRMRDGTWVPARKERTQFDSNGRVIAKDEWHYEHLSVNEPLPARAISLMFFRLPPGTQVYGAPTDEKRSAAPSKRTPSPTAVPRTARPTATPTPSGGMIRLY